MTRRVRSRLCLIAMMAGLALALSGCGRRPAASQQVSPDPTTRLVDAAQRAATATYRAEYDTAVSMTMNGQSQTEQLRYVVQQAGARRQVNTYVRGIVLVHSLIENEQGQFACAYVTDPERPRCLRLVPETSAPGTLLDGLRYAVAHGLITLQTTTDTVQVADRARACQQFHYQIRADRMTPELLQGIAGAIWPQQTSEQAHFDTDPGIRSMAGSFCLDAELGIPLTASSTFVYERREADGAVQLSAQATETLVWLVQGPLINPDAITLPLGAEVVP